MARFQLAIMTQPNSINLKSTAQVSDKALKSTAAATCSATFFEGAVCSSEEDYESPMFRLGIRRIHLHLSLLIAMAMFMAMAMAEAFEHNTTLQSFTLDASFTKHDDHAWTHLDAFGRFSLWRRERR